MFLLFLACLSSDEDSAPPTGSETETETGDTTVDSDSGDTADSGDSGDTGDTGDTGEVEPERSFTCQAPELIVARAGPNQVLASGTLSLDGSASSGPDALSYAWTLSIESESGSSTESFETAQVSYDLPAGFQSLGARLVVSGGGDSHKDFVLVHASDAQEELQIEGPEHASLGETLTFTSPTGEKGTLIQAPTGSAATGTSFVADKAGIYAVRFTSAEGDKSIARVYVSAPVLTPWDYAPVGEYQLSATGFEHWSEESSVRWTRDSNGEYLGTGDCITIQAESPWHQTFKAVISDADGKLLDREYPEFVFVDGGTPMHNQVQLADHGRVMDQWLTSEGFAERRSSPVELRIATLPFTDTWGADLFSFPPSLAAPLETDSGLVWLLGYGSEGTYIQDASGTQTKLSAPGETRDYWELVGDLSGDGVSEFTLAGDIYDPVADTHLATPMFTDRDGDYITTVFRGGRAADYNGDGRGDLAWVHEVNIGGNSGCADYENQVDLVLGPLSGTVDLDSAQTTFGGTHCSETKPALQVGDVDQDGYPDLVY